MQIEKTMKALYVRKLFLWPRYQGAVKDSLEKHECEVCRLTCMHECVCLLYSYSCCTYIGAEWLHWYHEQAAGDVGYHIQRLFLM